MANNLRIDGWEFRQYSRFLPALCNKKWAQNLDPKVIWHDAAGVFANKNVLYNFAVYETKKPVTLWYADPYTTSLAYNMVAKFDGVRQTDINGNPVIARKGYEVKLQTIDLNRIAWGCRSSMGVSNFCGEYVIQLEDLMYSRDAGNLTEDELYRRGLVQAEIAEAIMRLIDRDWIPIPYLNTGKPYPQSAGQANGQRISRKDLKTGNIGGANVLQHSVMPKPNDHGDCGNKDFATICAIARHELNQKLPEETDEVRAASATKIKVEIKSFTPQVVGRAQAQVKSATQLLETATKQLETANKLLTKE